MIEWAMIKWRGGGLSYRTGQGLSGTDSELELWEELAAEIARLREQLAEADVKLSDAGHDLRKRDAAIASLTTRAETAEARVAELEALLNRLKLRIAYIGMPQEPHRDRGDGVMVPDWSEECEALEAALSASGVDVLARGWWEATEAENLDCTLGAVAPTKVYHDAVPCIVIRTLETTDEA